MRKKEIFRKYKNPVSVIYCYATSYPKSQWLITSTILFAHDSEDVQFEVELREDCSPLSPMVLARVTWGWRIEGATLPCVGVVLAAEPPCSYYKNASFSGSELELPSLHGGLENAL